MRDFYLCYPAILTNTLVPQPSLSSILQNQLGVAVDALTDPLPINDSFPDEQLAVINASSTAPWYADYANYIVAKFIPPSFTYQQKKRLFYD